MSQENEGAFGSNPFSTRLSLLDVDDEHRAAAVTDALAEQHMERGNFDVAEDLRDRARRHWHRAAWFTQMLLIAQTREDEEPEQGATPEAAPEAASQGTEAPATDTPPDLTPGTTKLLSLTANLVEMGGLVH